METPPITLKPETSLTPPLPTPKQWLWQRFVATLLAVVLMIVMTQSTVRGTCVEGFAKREGNASHSDSRHHPASEEDGNCEKAPGSDLCKCPCHVIKIVLPRMSNTVGELDLHLLVRLPYADPERDVPVFDIFQPPKLSS